MLDDVRGKLGHAGKVFAARVAKPGPEHQAKKFAVITQPQAATTPAKTPVVLLDDPSLFISRELSWLEFNDRVLEEALDARTPLLERLKFVAIYGTNLDEFFMIRVAAMKQQIEAQVVRRSEDGRTPTEHLAAISQRLRTSLPRQMHVLNDDLLPALEREGIRLLRVSELDDETQNALERTFDESVFPVLTPLAVDSGHPFPYISNLSLSLAVELEEATRDGIELHFARVKIPPTLPRFVPVGEAANGRPPLRAARRSHLAPPRRALPRHARARLISLPGDARRRPRSTRGRGRRSAAGDRVGAAAPPLRRTGALGDRARHAGVHARFSLYVARARRRRLLRNRRINCAQRPVADR